MPLYALVWILIMLPESFMGKMYCIFPLFNSNQALIGQKPLGLHHERALRMDALQCLYALVWILIMLPESFMGKMYCIFPLFDSNQAWIGQKPLGLHHECALLIIIDTISRH